MELGLLTAILGDLTFKEVVEYASKRGFAGLEVACWPSGKAERRYAGVSHIEINDLTEEKIKEIKKLCADNNIAISALSYYPNILDNDREKAKACEKHLIELIYAAKKLDVNVVGTFIGRDQTKSVEYNMNEFSAIWPEIVKEAEKNNVKIAIENCPMLFTDNEWPGGQNLASSTEILRRMFDIIPSRYFGLNFDPSHYVWQQMDYIKPLYEFKEKIFHVHLKDIKVDYTKLRDVGVLATPLQYMSPKIPGHGDVDWPSFINALYDIGYDGYAALEIEDKDYENGIDDIKNSIEISQDYLKNFFK